MRTNILQYLEETSARCPGKTALSDGTRGMTFGELSEASKKIGSALCGQGYRSEPIGILMEKSPEEVAAFLGCVYAGCYYVPLDASMPALRMETILKTAGVRAIIADAKGGKIAEKLSCNLAVLPFEGLMGAEIQPKILAAIRERQIDTDPIYIVFTSGSTGVPKGVIACHRSVIDYTEALCEALPFSQETVFGNQTPLFFDAPLKELMPTLKYGATTVFIPKMFFLFPVKLCEFLNEQKINTVCWVVSALTMISSMGVLEIRPPETLGTVCFGSEVFPIPQYRLWRKALPNADFYNLYGPTEATGMSCYWKADRELADGEPIPIGKPFCNTGLLLIREDGTEAPDGEIGEIYLRGTCVTLGYDHNSEKTSEAFVQNPLNYAYPETVYRTGDLAHRNERGELIFHGRRDAQIKLQGHRIELGEIESAAGECPDCRRACAVFHAEEKRIVLCYEGNTTAEALTQFLKERLPRYMLPSLCLPYRSLPLTPNGKLDRKKLLAETAENRK